MMKRLAVASGMVLLAACGSADFYSEDQSIDGREWDAGKKISFEIDVQDTLSFYDFFIDFRHNDDYAYSDIYLFFDIDFPNGKSAHDTIHYIMQDFDGKWFGENSGSIVQNHVLIKPKTGFPISGKYKMHIRHAMRDEKLQGIEDVGLTITKKK